MTDAREVSTPEAIAEAVHDHLGEAQGDGRVRSLITVFAPARDDGRQLMPWYGDRARSRAALWTDRVTRRWKLWKRLAW